MPEQWVVLLEAAGDAACGPVDADDLKTLHETLEPGHGGGVLHSSDRYALQITAMGANPIEALVDVAARWADAVRRLGLPAWKLVRTEVFTPEDLEREFESADREEIGVQDAESGPDHDEIGHELLYRAFSDPLTGLLARHAFTHRLQAVLAVPRPVAVVSLDLDRFQGVNVRFGGATGDEVLIALAQRLAAMLRPTDVLARLAGDEYGVVLEGCTGDAAQAVAQRMLETVRLPMSISGEELIVSASAGVVLSQPGESAEAVLDNVEAALAVAKVGGGGPVLYGSDVSHHAQRRQHVVMPVLQDRLAHLQLLQHATVAANEADTLHQAAQVVMRHICAQVGCAIGRLWVSPAVAEDGLPGTPLWHFAGGVHDSAVQEASEELLAHADVGLGDRVVSTARSAWIAESADDDAGLKSAFAFPVKVGAEVVAALAFFSRTPMEPTDSFLDVLAGIGTQLGRVVERQRAAEALRGSNEQLLASEGRLREAEGLARLGSWHFDLRTGEGSWSEGTGALYGIDPRKPLDLASALGAVHADDRSRAEAVLSRLVERAESFAEDIRIVRADDQVRWHRTQGSAITDDNGVVVAIQGTSQDITDDKLAQDGLLERERQLAEAQRAAGLGWWEHELSSTRTELYQRIVETTHEGIVIVDFENVIAFVNPGMAQILGYSTEEMMGMPASAFVDDDTQSLLASRQKRRREGISEHYQTQLRAKDGSAVQVLVSASPFMDEDGRHAGALAMVTDITAVREAEDIVRSQSLRIQAEVDEDDPGESRPLSESPGSSEGESS